MDQTPDRAVGRPRDPAADDAILTATLGILAEHGYTGLTMDRVADRAGVSKATIYRRWSSKDDVLLAAVDRLSRTVPAPDTGDLHGDLTAIVDGIAQVFSSPDIARLTGAIIARITLDPDLAKAVRSGFLADRRAAAAEAIERGQRRGQVRIDIDIAVAVDLLAAPFYYRLLISGQPIDDDFARTVVDAAHTWLTRPRTHEP